MNQEDTPMSRHRDPDGDLLDLTHYQVSRAEQLGRHRVILDRGQLARLIDIAERGRVHKPAPKAASDPEPATGPATWSWRQWAAVGAAAALLAGDLIGRLLPIEVLDVLR